MKNILCIIKRDFRFQQYYLIIIISPEYSYPATQKGKGALVEVDYYKCYSYYFHNYPVLWSF